LRGVDLRRQLAAAFMGMPVGSRLPTVRELAATLGASRSAVQLMIAQLEQEGAVEIERRGPLGATLVARSLAMLWEVASGGPFVAALPLPSTLRIQGLATGIRTMLTEAGIESFIIYLREPRERLRALEAERCHLAVMSNLVADELCDPADVAIQLMPPGTYAEDYRVFTTASSRWDRAPMSATNLPILSAEDLAVVGPHGEAATPYTDVRLTPEDVRQVRNSHPRAALVWAYANPFFEALTNGVEAECERLGIEIVATSDYGSRPSNMKTAVASVLAHNPDMLLAICMDPEAGEEAFRPAVNCGVKIVLLSSLPRGFVSGRDYVGIVTGDQYAMGRGAADMLAEAIGRRGKVGILHKDTPFYVQNLRDQIAKTVFVRDYPGISIVAEEGYATDDEVDRIASAMLAAHPDINGIYVTSQEAAEGVVTALRAARRPDVKVTSIDLGPTTLLDIARGGNMYGLTAELTVEMGATMVREAALAMLGKPVPAFTVVNALNVTRVAVDRDSATVKRLVKREFPDRLVQLLPVTYPQFVRLFQDGEVELAIWDIGDEHALLPPGTQDRPLSREVQAEVGDRATRAAFVMPSDATAVRAVVREYLAGAQLLSIQREVLDETRLPEY
jgi:ribose transport system substrate-binding protein